MAANDLPAHPGGLKFQFFHFPLHSDDAAEPEGSGVFRECPHLP